MRKLVGLFLGLLPLLGGCGGEAGSSNPLSTTPPLTIGAPVGRPAAVVLPADYDITKRYPLVILLHGYGANAQANDLVFRLALRTTAYQFILVLPEGTMSPTGQQFWDATPECCNFTGTPVDDVGYLADLMEEAMATYAVDRHRIRLVGHSNGGYMAYRYVCEHPIAVDRIAVLAGSTYIDPAACTDPQPVSVLHLHGTLDDTVPYERSFDNAGLRTVGAVAAVERWAGVAHCASELELIDRRDFHPRIRNAGDAAETEIYRASCPGDVDIELWKSIGADHIFLTVNDAWRDGVAAFLSE